MIIKLPNTPPNILAKPLALQVQLFETRRLMIEPGKFVFDLYYCVVSNPPSLNH
jgi:hypothetical protein